jgi:hypothetical protein
LSGPAWTTIHLLMLPSVAGMKGTYYHTQLFLLRWGSHELFCLGWPQTMILPISASPVAWITGQAWPQ